MSPPLLQGGANSGPAPVGQGGGGGHSAEASPVPVPPPPSPLFCCLCSLDMNLHTNPCLRLCFRGPQLRATPRCILGGPVNTGHSQPKSPFHFTGPGPPHPFLAQVAVLSQLVLREGGCPFCPPASSQAGVGRTRSIPERAGNGAQPAASPSPPAREQAPPARQHPGPRPRRPALR